MATVETFTRPDIGRLQALAHQLRIHSIVATTVAGSGHPTTCLSAAEIMAALFFGVMRYDPHNPRNPNNDRFILSKGHAAPILYAAWAEAGRLPVEELLKLRTFASDLEGHPTPRLDFVDVATGSLGQGLSIGVGMALAARLDGRSYRTYVLMGDGEIAEGSVWEAAALAAKQGLDNLVAIADINRLGQSMETALGHQVELYQKRFESFGWAALLIDGHDMGEVLEAFEQAARHTGRPTAIIARTYKGAGVSFLADQPNWHGKPLQREEMERALQELSPRAQSAQGLTIPPPLPDADSGIVPRTPAPFSYAKGQSIATREAFGSALLRLGSADPRIVVLDADTQNSTYSEKFARAHPERFIQCYLAEQNMVGVGVGMGTRGRIPVAATFACFFSRATDQLRMAGISTANLKLCGSHAGVSIGEDGPSQMGLEDFAIMRAIAGSTVLCPADAVAAERLTEEMLARRGITYLRTARPKMPVIYDNDETFPIGGSKVLRRSDGDRATVVATGVTVFEALKAHDELAQKGIGLQVIDAYSLKPLDQAGLLAAARRTNDTLITVEDHYPEGGLGDAVAGTLSAHGISVHKLAVTELPRSGKPEELLDRYGISARHIVRVVEGLVPGQS